VDPTHFRNILNNIAVTVEDISTGSTDMAFAELQVHHNDILKCNDESHAHDHYDFFRSMLGGGYSELDSMLERTMLLFQQAQGVPVLLSMLVLIFLDRKRAEEAKEKIKALPRSRYELYDQAISASIRGRSIATKGTDSIRNVLQQVAVKAHLGEVRDFGQELVAGALEKDELVLWSGMERAQQLPLVKVLEVGGTDDGVIGGAYQFKHLSLQEALFARAVANAQLPDWDPLAHLEEQYYANVFRMGSERVGEVLASRLKGTVEVTLNDVQASNMLLCLPSALAASPGARLALHSLKTLSLGTYNLSLAEAQHLGSFFHPDLKSFSELRFDLPFTFGAEVAAELAIVSSARVGLDMLGEEAAKLAIGEIGKRPGKTQPEMAKMRDTLAILLAASLHSLLPLGPVRDSFHHTVVAATVLPSGLIGVVEGNRERSLADVLNTQVLVWWC
jgi:hypothetical protein